MHAVLKELLDMMLQANMRRYPKTAAAPEQAVAR
jgi:hypothetical protein